MPSPIGGVVARLQDTVRQFTLAQRTLAIIGIAGLVLGAVTLSAWLGRPTMSPLFSNLSAADASAVVEQLEGEGVEFELTDGGSTIMVPAESVYPQRLAAAAAGLPANTDGGGYSLLDDMGMTSSEFQQEVTYQRAVEGELAKTIGAITGVEAATVRLALPEESVFVAETADPTASVFIQTAPGVSLSADKVQSIVHLVSAGIEGMAPTDVAVVDAEGRVLSAVGGASTGGLQGNQVAEYEGRVAANVQTMLEKIVGAGNAVVSVTADLDFDQTARTSETWTATEGLPPLSSESSTENYTGAGAPVGGILGPDGLPLASAAGADSTYNRESSTVNNPVNKVTEEMTTTPGAVRRQSISVVVSQEAGGALNMPDLEQAVIAAAGVDTARGDVVSVSRMAFDTSGAQEAEEALAAAAAAAEAEESAELIKMGAIAGGVLLLLIVAVILGARRSKRARREAIDLGALEMVETRPEAVEAPPTVLALPAADPRQEDLAAKRQDVMALAAEQPGEVADVLRDWLAGSKS